MNTYQLRLRLTGYETSYLQEHLKTYLDRIQRHKPETAFEAPHLETNHPILYIESEETTEIPAYNLFTITVNLIQDFSPSRVYFRASFATATNPWPAAQYVRHPCQPEHCSGSVLPFTTTSGFYKVPSIYPLHQTIPVEISRLIIHTTFENLQYSIFPFSEQTFQQVETVNGFLSFSSSDLNVPAPSVQNPPPPPSTRRVGYGPAGSMPTADLMHSMLANESYNERDFFTPLQVANESMLENNFQPRQPNHNNRAFWSTPPPPSPRHGQARFQNPEMIQASQQGRRQLRDLVHRSLGQPRTPDQSVSSDDPPPPRVPPPSHIPATGTQQQMNPPTVGAQHAFNNLSLGDHEQEEIHPMLHDLYYPGQPPEIPQILTRRPSPTRQQANSPPITDQVQSVASPVLQPPPPPPPLPGTTPPGPRTPSAPTIPLEDQDIPTSRPRLSAQSKRPPTYAETVKNSSETPHVPATANTASTTSRRLLGAASGPSTVASPTNSSIDSDVIKKNKTVTFDMPPPLDSSPLRLQSSLPTPPPGTLQPVHDHFASPVTTGSPVAQTAGPQSKPVPPQVLPASTPGPANPQQVKVTKAAVKNKPTQPGAVKTRHQVAAIANALKKLDKVPDALNRPNKQQRLAKASKTEVMEFPDHIKTYVDTLLVVFASVEPPHPVAVELYPFIFQDPAKCYHSDYTKATPYIHEILESCFDLDNSVVDMAKTVATDLYQTVTRTASKERN